MNIVYHVNKWAERLKPILEKLPDYDDPRWSSYERSKWITALTALIDLYIIIENEDDIPF